MTNSDSLIIVTDTLVNLGTTNDRAHISNAGHATG